MRNLASAIFLVFIAASPPPSKAPCPKVGWSYPWMIKDLMAGDRYAEVYIDINSSGEPVKCGIGHTNIRKDQFFWICNSFMQQWRIEPPAGLTKGERMTLKRTYVEYGKTHDKAERKARKEFFLQNPSERPGCYPGGA